MLAVSKPAGLLSQGDRTGDDTVVMLAKTYLKNRYHKPGNVYLGLVHRLDRPVSGVMILAKTSKAARRLSAVFQQRRPKKLYLALAEGRLAGQGQWEDALVKVKGKAHIVPRSHPGAKDTLLSWRALVRVRGCTLTVVQLHTGRAHQIRCQLAHRGYPILGDKRYGARRTFDGRNLALHSYRLVVPHPVLAEPVSVTAPLPETWRPWVISLPDGL